MLSDGHTITALICRLGRPFRSFIDVFSAEPTHIEHEWRCGCAAREVAGASRTQWSPCAVHTQERQIA
jgi:hypothetical protein